MSILIKGMEMPKSCVDCNMPMEWCNKWIGVENGKRSEDCPLVPVPPHGALIDRDDFFAACPELVDGYKTITDDLVVLTAEESET